MKKLEIDVILENMNIIFEKRLANKSIEYEYLSYILFAYYYSAYKGTDIGDRLTNILDIYDQKQTHNSSFWYGKAGLGFVLNNIDCIKYSNRIQAYKTSAEIYLEQLCFLFDISKFGYKVYDYFVGMVGVCIFLLDVSNEINMHVEKCLNILIKNILESDENLNKFCINKVFSKNPKINKLVYNEKYVDLGKAHGLAGILSLLKNCLKREYKNLGLLDSIKKLENFYLKIKRKDGITLWERIYLANGVNVEINNSWCYGNLGILTSMYDKIEKYDILCINKICIEKIMHNEKIDYFFCHGIVGEIFMINQINSDFCEQVMVRDYLDSLIEKISILDLHKVDSEFSLNDIFSVLDGIFSIVLVYILLYGNYDKLLFEKLFLIENR